MLIELDKIFPPVEWACAYGSVALPQANHDTSKSMLDVILVVSDPVQWHHSNRLVNPLHYSSPAWMDGWVQSWGGAIYYLPNITLPGGKLIKYGVIDKGAFLADLLEWRNLYLAGRLHKPILTLAGQEKFVGERDVNFRHAANVATLLSPRTTSIEEFLRTLVGISYLGDFRTSIAEDPRKVSRIVQGQADRLWDIYRPHLKDFSLLSGDSLEFDDSPMCVVNRLSALPSNLLRTFRRRTCLFMAADQYGREEARIREKLAKSIASISRLPALLQAMKGVLTAGPGKSVSYAFAKLSRRFR